jgi:phospho-N-acetylmuramoyl-pentapeptide-transferase
MNAKSPSLDVLKKPTGIQLLVLLTVLLLGLSVGLGPIDSSFQAFPDLTLLLPLGVTALLSGLLGYGVVPLLRQLKAGQVIQEDGPQSHLKKAGTPTMGGIFFVPVAIAVAFLWTGFNLDVVAVGLVTLAYMGIGWVDDGQILLHQSNSFYLLYIFINKFITIRMCLLKVFVRSNCKCTSCIECIS